MLVLSRKAGESLLIDGRIRVTVLGCGSRARIGIEAPANIHVVRSEIAFDFVEPTPAEERPTLDEVSL